MTDHADTIRRDPELEQLLERIRAAIQYDGDADHEDVASIVGALLAERQQAIDALREARVALWAAGYGVDLPHDPGHP